MMLAISIEYKGLAVLRGARSAGGFGSSNRRRPAQMLVVFPAQWGQL
jgi:hypothetical protein